TSVCPGFKTGMESSASSSGLPSSTSTAAVIFMVGQWYHTAAKASKPNLAPAADLKKRIHALLEFPMGRRGAIAELKDVADAEARVGERQASERLVQGHGQGITVVVAHGDFDSQGSQGFE